MIRKPSSERLRRRRAGASSSGTFVCRNASLSVDRVLGEGARLQLDRQATGGGVARLVARRHRQRRAGGEVVGQRDQRDARAAVRRAVGEAREDARADVDVHAGGVGRAERDQHGAARRDVARGGEQLEPRRREVDRHRDRRQGAVAAAERPPEVVARPTPRSWPRLPSTRGRGLDRDRQRHPRAQRRGGARDRRGRAALHDAYLGLLQLAARGLERDGHGGVVAEELRGPARWRAGRGRTAARRDRTRSRPPRGGAAARRRPTPWYGTADARRRS